MDLGLSSLISVGILERREERTHALWEILNQKHTPVTLKISNCLYDLVSHVKENLSAGSRNKSEAQGKTNFKLVQVNRVLRKKWVVLTWWKGSLLARFSFYPRFLSLVILALGSSGLYTKINLVGRSSPLRVSSYYQTTEWTSLVW